MLFFRTTASEKFEGDWGMTENSSERNTHDRPADETVIERLEHELRDTRERLSATLEEYEAAVEELRSSNADQQSINAEMLLANRELVASARELQSGNEVLQTVKAELHSRVREIDLANSDLQNVFDTAQIAALFLDRDLVIRSFTPSVAAIFNLVSADRGRPLTDLAGNLENGGDLGNELAMVLEHGKPMERCVRHSDGKEHYLMRALPYRGRGDVIDGALVTFIDITPMVETEKQQQALVDELNHRIRNIFAVVSALAKQTFARSRSPEEFKEAFTGRVQSMARSYGLVTREHWTRVKLHDILNGEFAAVLDETTAKQRLTLDGPPIAFTPSRALSLGVVFHELTANALRHGALSTPEGKVAVGWTVETSPRETVELKWVEKAGKKAAKPAAKGLGLQLIEREVEGSLGGTVKFSYGLQGLSVRITIPMDENRAADRLAKQ